LISGAAGLPAAGALGRLPLVVVLSLAAGSADVIGFLGLGGLFTAHITGNLAILAARIVGGDPAPLAPLLSVPVFMAVLCLARLLAGLLEARGIASLRPLLALQFLLLTAFLGLAVAGGPRIDPDARGAVLAGMAGVAAMAVQNALVQVSLQGVPATAVMTTNVTRLAIDVGTVLLGPRHGDMAAALSRIRSLWPVVAGFAAGCALGTALEAAAGLWSLALPAGLALLALPLGGPRAATTGRLA
jgi:uncharacterized membrane protein YoaK (UPF0700 family)